MLIPLPQSDHNNIGYVQNKNGIRIRAVPLPESHLYFRIILPDTSYASKGHKCIWMCNQYSAHPVYFSPSAIPPDFAQGLHVLLPVFFSSAYFHVHSADVHPYLSISMQKDVQTPYPDYPHQ